MSCFVQLHQDEKDYYWTWLKRKGCHDFIEELVTYDEDVHGLHLGGTYSIMNIDMLTAEKLDDIINILNGFER